MASVWQRVTKGVRLPPIGADEAAEGIELFSSGEWPTNWDWNDFVDSPGETPAVRMALAMSKDVFHAFPASRPGQYCSEEGWTAMRLIAEMLRARKPADLWDEEPLLSPLLTRMDPSLRNR